MRANIENYLTDENEVSERVAAVARMRDNYGFFVVGDEENVAQIDTALADFDALIMTQYQLCASIANVVATKLLGTSPKGFNATGEHEIRTYEEEQQSIQTNDMSPLLERHHAIAARSELSGYGELRISHTWNKRQLSDAEKAELNNKKAQTAQVLLSAGAISNEEERARLKADPDSEYAAVLQDEGGEEESGALEEFLAASMDGEFREDQVKRDKDGRFGSGGGGDKGAGGATEKGEHDLDADLISRANGQLTRRDGDKIKADYEAVKEFIQKSDAIKDKDEALARLREETQKRLEKAAKNTERMGKTFKGAEPHGDARKAQDAKRKYDELSEKKVSSMSESDALEHEKALKQAYNDYTYYHNKDEKSRKQAEFEFYRKHGTSDAVDAEFDENKHRRAKDGKFGKGGGGSASVGGSEPDKGKQDITKLLGKEHTGVKGQAAIDLLMREKNGHVKGAFYRSKIGHIDLFWGDEERGLKHILARRLKRGIDPQQFVADLSSVIANGTIKKKNVPGQGTRYLITKGTKTAIVATELNREKMTYVLTAFQP